MCNVVHVIFCITDIASVQILLGIGREEKAVFIEREKKEGKGGFRKAIEDSFLFLFFPLDKQKAIENNG